MRPSLLPDAKAMSLIYSALLEKPRGAGGGVPKFFAPGQTIWLGEKWFGEKAETGGSVKSRNVREAFCSSMSLFDCRGDWQGERRVIVFEAGYG